MNGRRASLAAAHDPAAARFWRAISWLFAIAGVAVVGSGGGLVVAHALNTGVWAVPGTAFVLGLFGIGCGVLTLVASAACMQAMVGPADAPVDERALYESYPATAPTSSVPLPTGVAAEVVVPPFAEDDEPYGRRGAHRLPGRWTR